MDDKDYKSEEVQITLADPGIKQRSLPAKSNEPADKDKEIANLKAIIAQKDGQLNVYKYQSDEFSNKKQIVLSLPAFFSLLVLILLLGSLAVYSLFFSNPRPRGSITSYSDSDTRTMGYSASSILLDSAAFLDSVNKTLNKGIDTILKKVAKENPADKEQTPAKPEIQNQKKERHPKKKKASSSLADSIKTSESTNDEREQNSNLNVRYSIAVSKAYIYDQPDMRSKRPLYLSADTGSSDLTASDESNGFIYVVFFNTEGKITKGWLRKQDLRISN